MHNLIVPDDLDGHLLVAPQAVPSPHHIGEDTLTCVTIDSIPEKSNKYINNIKSGKNIIIP